MGIRGMLPLGGSARPTAGKAYDSCSQQGPRRGNTERVTFS